MFFIDNMRSLLIIYFSLMGLAGKNKINKKSVYLLDHRSFPPYL